MRGDHRGDDGHRGSQQIHFDQHSWNAGLHDRGIESHEPVDVSVNHEELAMRAVADHHSGGAEDHGECSAEVFAGTVAGQRDGAPEREIRGEYQQRSLKVTDATGQEVEGMRAEDSTSSSLLVGNGTVVWNQQYSGQSTVQTYAYTVDKTIEVKDGLEIKLTFTEMKSSGGYRPEDHEPKLTFRVSDSGIKVVFSGTDSAGHLSIAECARK